MCLDNIASCLPTVKIGPNILVQAQNTQDNDILAAKASSCIRSSFVLVLNSLTLLPLGMCGVMHELPTRRRGRTSCEVRLRMCESE